MCAIKGAAPGARNGTVLLVEQILIAPLLPNMS